MYNQEGVAPHYVRAEGLLNPLPLVRGTLKTWQNKNKK